MYLCAWSIHNGYFLYFDTVEKRYFEFWEFVINFHVRLKKIDKIGKKQNKSYFRKSRSLIQ